MKGEPQEHQKFVTLLVKEQGRLGHECHTWRVELSVEMSLAGSTGVLRNMWKRYTKGRISLRNKAFYANKDLFRSKLLTKNSKLRMYKTLVRPMITYACETWVLKENTKNQTMGI